MRFLWLLLSVATVPGAMAAEPESRLKLLATVERARANPGSPLVFSPDGKFLAFVARGMDDRGCFVMVWDLAKREAAVEFDGAEPELGSPVFSPDGKNLAAVCRAEGGTTRVRLWDLATKKEVAALAGGHGPLAFGPDGKTLAVGGKSSDGTDYGLRLWEMATRKDRAFFPTERGDTRVGLVAGCVAFSVDGKYLAVGSAGFAKDGQRLGGAVALWDATTGKEKGVVPHLVFPTSVAFSPNRARLAAADLSGNVLLWDVEAGKRAAMLQAFSPRNKKNPANPIYSVAFSPDGKILAAGTMLGIKLWVVPGHNKSVSVEGPEATVWSVAFSPDGKTLATAGSEKGVDRPEFATETTIRLWQWLPATKTEK